MENQKELEYATKVIEKLGQLFDKDDDCFIDIEDLKEDDNLTIFMHVLANIATTHVYNQFTDEGLNALSFNHIANRLCFKYLKIVD